MKKKVELFKNDNLKKLVILNSDDFVVPSIMESVSQHYNGGAFSLADEDEIKARNQLMGFLFDNPQLREQIKSWNLSRSNCRNLPKDENSFLSFYENENPYWKIVETFLTQMKNAKQIPDRLLPYVQQIQKSFSFLQLTEEDMATSIGDKLKKVTRMEGIADFIVAHQYVSFCEFEQEESDKREPVIIGQKAFSAEWSHNYIAPIAKVFRSPILRWTGVKAMAQLVANVLAAKRARKSSIIRDFPSSLADDLEAGLGKALRLSVMYKDAAELDNPQDKKINTFLNNMPKLKIRAYFVYNERGLSVTPVQIKVQQDTVIDKWSESQAEDLYTGYTNEEQKLIFRRFRNINTEINRAQSLQSALKINEFLAKNMGFVIGSAMHIQSSRTDDAFRWYYINNLYNSKEHVKSYNQLTENRDFFWSLINELNDLVRIIDIFKFFADKHQLDLCVPEIRNQKTGVRFANLAPINMIEQNKKMVPFSFPEINGRIICLTGKHGRGKSVAGNSILQSLWLAQSGLLVFASQFSCDVKEMIGAVTNDLGEGSKATVFVQKTMNLFKNISELPAHKSLIFIDEIGSNTQESAGAKLGERILRKLSIQGNSVIFNTQIISLAEYAKVDLNAICLKVDNEHQFSEGIGEGMMDDLITEVGLDKYL